MTKKRQRFTEATKAAVQGYVNLHTGMSIIAALNAGAEILAERHGFSDDQQAAWYAATKQRLLDNVEKLGQVDVT